MPARMFDGPPIDGATNGTEVDPIPEFPKLECTETVVISGISGRLPESDNITEFREHLFLGKDMVTDDNRRWEPGLFDTPTRTGKLKDISKFDASFFGVHPKQADAMDPQLRLLLEVTYEAIVDAGVDPQSLKGSKTGVFIGVSTSEAHEAWAGDPETVVGYHMTGCCRSMFANRLSFFFDLKGPSYAIDTACSSSLLALDQALLSIRMGHCDAAIVGGSSLCLKPTTALQFKKLGMLAPDGSCKSFDASGDGYCRSEAIVAILVQKSSCVKRKYAAILHSKNNCDGGKEQGITFPSGEVQKRLLMEIYSEACINPATVAYVEAHGTGTKAGDPQELNTIVDVFCKGRQGPLLIGSIKSNMGHPEPASGLAALAKVLIAMEYGMIPPNLHYKEPNPDILGLLDGRLKVVSKLTKWNGGIVGLNSFGFGGSNVHAVLLSNQSERTVLHPASNVCRLCVYSGRIQEAVKHVLKAAQEESNNIDFHALLEETACSPQNAHPYRGYTILNSDSTDIEVQKCSPEKRPVWFVFAGMGTQWHGMGRHMMQLDIFRQSIMKSETVLAPLGISLYDLLMKGDERTFENTLHSFVGIAAIQVALLDLLTALGIQPDGIVGHSVGELGCGYADGSLTAEETVLAAYWRGHCIMEASLPEGRMAAVGLTWEEAKEQCPEGVVPACHNAKDTVTISGPAAIVSKFVLELKERGIFAKEVNSSGVAFHSYYMGQIAQTLKTALDKVIVPKQRTSRWISSSIPETKWDSQLAKYSSASYHVNNLVSPVLFQEALQHIPQNALTIEIAPHCLLQAILKRSLGAGCVFVGLMKRFHPNNLAFFYSSLGKCYSNGLNFNPLKFFQPVSFPVPRGTAMIGPLIKWDHSQDWDVPKVNTYLTGGSGKQSDMMFEVDASPEAKDHYLVGHKIDGRVLFPATGYLVLAWRALARMRGVFFEQMSVEFENFSIHRATILPKTGTIKFEVSIMQLSGNFEICESGTLAASGRLFVPDEPFLDFDEISCETSMELELNSADVYKTLRLRGYDYGPTFKGILKTNNQGNVGELLWTGNWISFLDTMLQMSVFGLPGKGLKLPTRITSIRINTKLHQEKVFETKDGQQALQVKTDISSDTCTAGGVEILGLHATVAPRRQLQSFPILEKFLFVPYEEIISSSALEAYTDYCSVHACGLLQKLINQTDVELPNKDFLKSVLSSCSGNTHSILEDQDVNLKLPNSGLLQVLHKLLHSAQNISNVLDAFQPELLSDKLLTSLLKPETLKMCLDVVFENTTTLKLKVAEVEATNGGLYRHVIPQLNTQPMIDLDYAATFSGDKEPSDAENFGFALVKWDISQPPPSSLQSFDLVMANNVLHMQQDTSVAIENLLRIIRDDGFVLLHEVTGQQPIYVLLEALTKDLGEVLMKRPALYLRDDQWLDCFEKHNLELICKKTGIISTLYLLRKRVATHNAAVVVVDNLDCIWVDDLKAKLQNCLTGEESDRLWVMSHSCPSNGVVGMVNCLRKESGGHKVRCIFNASLDGSTEDLSPDGIVFQQLAKKDLAMNIYRNGVWGSFRHVPILTGESMSTVETAHAYINVLTRGDLSSLQWIESPLKYFSALQHQNKELCHVYYASLNFRDIMLATGKLPPDAIPGNMADQDCILGMEFSGRSKSGKRIMGLLPAKGLATTVDADKRFLWEIPDSWSLEAAASVPVVYATVYYSLVVRGRIKKGDRVLIHSGSGGVGQAAISVALHHGCEVYTTIGSATKREYLKERFPQLQDRNFSNSRDTTFESHILRATKGKGVDVVLNSLADEKLQASIRVLAAHGRFLEIGKVDLSNNTPLGMAVFLRNISFHGILLDAIFEEGNKDWLAVFDLVSEGIKTGAVRPLKTTVFDKAEVEDAFRFMAQGKHIGKVLIKVRDEEAAKVVLPKPLKLSAIAKTACDPKKSYVITGGLGGFGLELAQWLVERGATKLVLTSRSGVCTGYQARKVRLWKEAGVEVVVSTRNVKTLEETSLLIEEANMLGPVGAVFHLAMVLKDGLMENQTLANFRTVCESKVTGTIHLDKVTRKVATSSLEWFVVFSSVSCGRGNAGQANYGFANSVMERICEQRNRDNLPGLAMQWGAIGDVGVVQELMGDNETVIGGTLPQRITSCLTVLDQFLNQTHPVMSSYVLAEKKKGTKGDAVGGKPNLLESVAHILGIKDISTLNQDATLADLGLDSLMGVEIKQTLERDYDLNLTTREIRQLSIVKIKAIGGALPIPTVTAAAAAAAAAPEIPTQAVESQQTNRYSFACLIPTETILPLNSVASKSRPLFIIHPLEGSTFCLETIASHLKCPTYGVQCTTSAPLLSLETLADYYLQHIIECQREGPYRIAGYSLGAAVAIEISLQLQRYHENQPNIVESLVLLDGSHKFVAAHTHTHRVKISERDDEECQVLYSFARYFIQLDYSKTIEDLRKLETFEDRLRVMTDKIMENKLLKHRDEVEIAAKNFYNLLLLGENYKPKTSFKGDITLIKVQDTTHESGHMEDDYGLKEVCMGKVKVEVIEGDHETFIQGANAQKVSNILNGIVGILSN